MKLKTKYLNVALNMQELAISISEEMPYEEIRQFISMICDAAQDYELDAGIYSDRVRDMKECMMEGETFSHENTLEHFPALKK